MAAKVKNFFMTIFNRRTKTLTSEEQAFNALVSKFTKIQYLVDQKSMVDVIEKAPVGICITNKDYVYEYVNPAYCTIYGYDADELIGKKFTMVVPPEYQQELMKLHDEFMDREYELEGEWQVVTKDGDLRHIQANAAYVIDEHRKPKKITFVLDVTERRIVNQALTEESDRRKTLADALKTQVLDPLRKIGDAGQDQGDLKAIADALEKLLSALG